MSMIDRTQITALIGEWMAALIDLIAAEAKDAGLSCYLVGGGVRDLIMRRPTIDLDFVVEGDAIAFADRLAAVYGGTITRHMAFGTAKWELKDARFPFDTLGRPPQLTYLDFAMTRAETYPYPGSLPVVQPAFIADDLVRRDFTVNALALQIAPNFGTIIDPFGGLDDIAARTLRVLHDRSFIDDPTRILRGARFATRLGFSFDAQTTWFAKDALPVFARVTGERLRSDLTLILAESDAQRAIHLLADWGVLTAIHPALMVDDGFDTRLERVRTLKSLPETIRVLAPDEATRAWGAWLALLTTAEAGAIAERLLFPKYLSDTIHALIRVVIAVISFDPDTYSYSTLADRLDNHPPAAIVIALLFHGDNDRLPLTEYLTRWRAFRPFTTGDDLRARGLKPGRCFGIILEELRAAHIDGEISTRAEEESLVDQWIADGICAE